VIESILKVSA